MYGDFKFKCGFIITWSTFKIKYQKKPQTPNATTPYGDRDRQSPWYSTNKKLLVSPFNF